MITSCLREDKRPSKLPVKFSPKIIAQIQAIENCNQNNKNAVFQWLDYIDGIRSYISNPAIAFDYADRFPQFPNGAKFINDFNYKAAFVVKTDKTATQSYVYVFMINLNLGQFGLKMPLTMMETFDAKSLNRKLIKLTEDDVCSIVRECVNMYLQENYYEEEPLFGWHSVERAYRKGGADKKTMNAIRKSYNKYEKECIRKGDIPNYLGFSLWVMDKDVASCKQGKGDMFPNYYLG